MTQNQTIESQNNTTLSEIASALTSTDNILILLHTNPDGDTLGSALALYYAIKTQDPNKTVYCLCDSIIPHHIEFITKPGLPILPEELPDSFSPSLIVAVDIAVPSLLGNLEEKYANKIDFKIDHHPTGSQFAKYNYVDTQNGSCGEIIFDLIDRMSLLSPETGAPLYLAIVSDTGRFLYSSVTPDSYRKVAKLLEIGTDTKSINQSLYENRTYEELNALRVTLNILHYYRDGEIAVLNFSNKIKNENGLSDDDIGGMSSFPRGIEGVEVSVTIKQNTDEPDKFRISLRSGNKVDCSQICSALGGGGHVRASGASVVAESPEEAEKIVLDKIYEFTEKTSDR